MPEKPPSTPRGAVEAVGEGGCGRACGPDAGLAGGGDDVAPDGDAGGWGAGAGEGSGGRGTGVGSAGCAWGPPFGPAADGAGVGDG
ncbi:hypothetical protein GCM10022252_38440 [Streptosporangium oxazolinicum]|uniref:Uncharacterized protein n=1 Tax=Streptosporangium oxazolinicum TaxID=909287 RepID=A0ABP8AZI6_9ACTN